MTAMTVATERPARAKRAQGVTVAVRNAVDIMIWQGKPFDEAAREVGLTSRAMRLALKKPAVIALFKAEQQMLLESMGPRNIHRLAAIRDAANNMPAVNSAVQLVRMRDEPNNPMRSGRSIGVTMPGLVIQIIQPSDPQPQIVRHEAANPLITLDRDSLHENVTP